jgi:hypothetical protein
MEAPVHPITIPAAIVDLKKQIIEIRKKNTILIGYYIDPQPVPTELLQHEPRLDILNTRLDSLAKLSYPNNASTGNLSYIIDQPAAVAAAYLNEIIDQLLNAIHGFQEIFEQRYDRDLKEKKPFGKIYDTLEYREKQLKKVIHEGRRLLPSEEITPSEPVYFCRGAVQLINGRDKGRVSSVLPNELSRENKAILNEFHGAYLWWQCSSCDFRARFHIAGSYSSSIHNTEEIREHPGCDVVYRTLFMAKSHLYSDPAYAVEGEIQVINRRPRAWSSRNSSGNIRLANRNAPKYGCVFCYAQGKDLDWAEDTMFRSGQHLAEHIAENHRKGKKIPAPLMLKKFCVAIEGRLGEGLRRWELKFK